MSLLVEADRQRLAEEWFGDSIHQVDDVVREVQAGSREYGFVKFVDNYRALSQKGWLADFNDLTIVIPEIEPRQLASSFGWESVIWAAAHARIVEKQTAHYKAMQALTGTDPDVVQRSVLWSNCKHKNSRAATILSELSLRAYISELSTLEAPALIQSFPEKDIVVSEERAAKYNLVPIQPTHYGIDGPCHDFRRNKAGVGYDIYLDSPAAVVLTYNELPIALASFGTLPNNEVGILQIQGVTGIKQNGEKYSPRGLAPLDWRGIFIEIGNQSARKIGASSICIQSSQHNKWRRSTADKNAMRTLTVDAARRSYDEPAQTHGFTLGEDGNWHRLV